LPCGEVAPINQDESGRARKKRETADAGDRDTTANAIRPNNDTVLFFSFQAPDLITVTNTDHTTTTLDYINSGRDGIYSSQLGLDCQRIYRNIRVGLIQAGGGKKRK